MFVIIHVVLPKKKNYYCHQTNNKREEKRKEVKHQSKPKEYPVLRQKFSLNDPKNIRKQKIQHQTTKT